MVASHSGATDIADLLKEYGADPSQRDEVSGTGYMCVSDDAFWPCV